MDRVPAGAQGELAQRWQQMDTLKGDLHRRCETYAGWTLPHIFPELHTKDNEQQQSLVTVGPRAVNHLANKVVSVLFPSDRPFFTLAMTGEAMSKLHEEFDEEQAAEIIGQVNVVTSRVERAAMRKLNMVRYRPKATLAAKNLIITGNALFYQDPKGVPQVYSVRDYCLQRDVSGNVTEFITRDVKAFGTFKKEVRDLLQAGGKAKNTEDSDVTLYTRVRLMDDGRYKVTQAANNVDLNIDVTHTKETLPWVPLVWHLNRGDDYGRGLVEDHAALFHATNVLTQSLVNGFAILSDIKFLVNPASQLDVAELNKSPSGSYHSGREGDISSPKMDRRLDMEIVKAAVQEYERQIAQSFLLFSGTTRDAERVTAEEIRFQANELETAYGGLYSTLAADWQQPTASLALKGIEFPTTIGDFEGFEPVVTTGLESLSRTGQMDSLRLFMADLAMLNEIPDEFRAVMDPFRYMEHVGANRQVDYKFFMKSRDDVTAEQEAAAAQEQKMLEAQGATDVAVEAGKQAVKDV